MEANNNPGTTQGQQPKGKEKKKKEKKPPREWPPLDYINRDPNELNTYTKCQFTDVIAEPAGNHSEKDTWFSVFKAYTVGQECCFSCLRLICAIPLAFLWGCCFAYMSFCQVYTVTPCLRAFHLECYAWSRFVSTLVHCFFDPCYEAMALMFTKIYVNIRKTDEPCKEKTYLPLYANAREKSTVVQAKPKRASPTHAINTEEIYMDMDE